ncbi:MAG: asparagine synthase (glutamine-hydrolyzing) [Polyangiaceae bacterium]|nr:asparagine synthase (glutamine-hydrolyzing) [Polyangiaceae bacterium]
MCGIAGIFRPGASVAADELGAMCGALHHRGPDARGTWRDGPVGLAHTRLRIVDLSEGGAQPMRSSSGRAVIVFNGEIYNYVELRRTLAARGHTFRSSSDTEVLLAAYEEWGAALLPRIEGMFAFAIWDTVRQVLLLARDRAGEKPLFWTRLPSGGVAFASEIKALLAVPALGIERDLSRIPDFLVTGYVPAPATFYRGVQHLLPAHSLELQADATRSPVAYWRPCFDAAAPAPSYAEAQEELRARMRIIVRDRLQADVPVGAFLSGGLDSASVVGVATRDLNRTVHTYSIGFEDPAVDESKDAQISARHLGSVHEEFIVGDRDIPPIELLVRHHDGPFGDSSAIPPYLVSKLARARVTVAVTGDGGDEIFGGYPRFLGGMLAEHVPPGAATQTRRVIEALKQTPLWRAGHTSSSPFARASRFAAAVERPLERRLLHWNAVFPPEQVVTLTRGGVYPSDAVRFSDAAFEEAAGQSPLARMLHHNFVTYLPEDLMVKVDRCSMAVSLETRSPLLDSGLIDFVSRLPDHYKVRGATTKRLLRDTFADLLAPELLRRPKRGFGVPLARWLSTELRPQLEATLFAEDAETWRHLDRDAVMRQVFGAPLDAARAYQAWALWSLETWLRQPA